MEAPISASLGAMGSLLGKLDEILATEHKEEIWKLREDLEITRTLLLKLSKARDPPVTARYWMKYVRELSYDLEDCVDAEIDWIQEKMPGFKSRVEELNELYHRYMLEDSVPSCGCVAIDHRLPAVDGRKAVVGLDGPIDRLCQLLSDQDPELKVVSIVGVAGIGKTTLAEQLWHKLGAFQCRAFVQTSKKPDMRGILRSILSQVRPHQPPPGVSDVRNLTQEIYQHLQDKSYFVIIDELWATSVWEVVSRAFPEGNHGSRIITTTETEDVALACCAYQSRNIFQMEPLSVQHTQELFSTALFGSGEKQLDKCSHEIMTRCGGLPQAIVSIASILASNQETETVENTEKEEQLNILQNFVLNDLAADTPFEEILNQVLNLCYNCLPSCLQTCLLYLSVYPENYIIFKEDLAKQWIVEGFVCASTKKETMELALSYFDKLVNMGLIRHIDVKNSDEVLSYAVHHMVHDFITSKSIEENFVTLMDYSESTIQLSDRVRRLSLQFGSAAYATTPASTRLSHVRSLTFIGLLKCLPSISEFKLLRVLILNSWGDQGSTSLDLTRISELLLLRYLQIICNVIVQLPDQMQGLEHMETLEINARPDWSLSHLRLGGGTDLPEATMYPSGSSTSISSSYPVDPVKTFELLLPICSLPKWIGQLNKLCTLKIVVRELLKDDISSLGRLPALTVLSLYVRRHTAEIIVFNTSQFAALEYFEFKCGVLSLSFQEGAMPNLQMLKLGFNAHKGEQYGHFLEGIGHLSNLKEVAGIIGVAGGAEEHDWRAAESAFKDAIPQYPKLHSEVSVKRAVWIEEEYDSPENQHMIQENHPPSEQPGKIKEESKEDIKQHLIQEKHSPSEQPGKIKDESDEDMKQHLIQEKHPPSEQPGNINEESDEDIKQNADSESASALSFFPHLDMKQKESISRAEGNLPTPVTMGIMDTVGVISGNLLQWIASSVSYMRSRWSASHEKIIQDAQDEVLRLRRGLERLRDTLPAMYGLIDRADWKSDEYHVAKLLPILKDAVYDADDILDEFRWYSLCLNVAGEGNATHSAFADFYKTTIQGSDKVNDIQERLIDISSKLNQIPGLHEVTPGFVRSLRPETISLPREKTILGRGKDLKQVMGLLGIPPNSKEGRRKRKRESSAVHASTSTPAGNQVSNASRVQAIPVLPIVGMGGIGKTTFAQHICNHRQVKSYFDLIIWICADDFDVKRLTNDAIQSSSGKQAKLDHLDSLQRALSENLSNKRFLIVIDDVWDDALKENGKRWEQFCAPFRNVVHGSMMLVTTRSPEVADAVRTMEPFPLDGLTDDVLWDFFKLCAFGSETSTNSPDLEWIGRMILPKLKGSPLAAITLGRLLRMDLRTSHWQNILESELLELPQKETDILPSLRLSYMYLPFHLKRCFSFCAVYPKYHKFEKDRLAEIWVAEGFVEPQGDTPLKDIGCQYFEDLFNRSFFQKVDGSYVIHDLLHDMAQLVSVHDCFIIKSVGDFKNVPQNVRHLYVLPNKDIDSSHLVSLSKHTKLRTLICKFYMKKNSVDSVIGSWFGELRRLRVLLCASMNEIPDSVGNLKHLRYLEITGACHLKSLPSQFCCLYNLQRLYAEKCKIRSFPNDFNKLISLQSFKSRGFQYSPMCGLKIDAASGYGPGITSIKNMNQFGVLRIRNLGAICKDEAAEAKLKNKKYLHTLKLDWSSSTSLSFQKHNETEVFEVLQLPASLEHLFISGYPGVSLPTWFQPQNFPRLATLSIENCGGLESSALSFSRVSQNVNPNDTLDNNDAITGTFSSLRDLRISGCGSIISLNDFLDPASVPAIKKIKIKDCTSLVSVPTGCLGDMCFLEELEVVNCQNIHSQRLVAPFLKSLKVANSGNLAHNIECCSLTYFEFSSDCDSSIPLQMWSIPALEELRISECRSLTSVGTGVNGAFSSLKSLHVSGCAKLSTLDDFLTAEHLPAIEKIDISRCPELLSLPSERLGTFQSLKEFVVKCCPRVNWQRGLILPSSLQGLAFMDCGDISAVFPSCLQNLALLKTLEIVDCSGITSIPGNVWQSYLPSLVRLILKRCADLKSIGGKEAIAKIQSVLVTGCPKMQMVEIGRITSSWSESCVTLSSSTVT